MEQRFLTIYKKIVSFDNNDEKDKKIILSDVNYTQLKQCRFCGRQENVVSFKKLYFIAYNRLKKRNRFYLYMYKLDFCYKCSCSLFFLYINNIKVKANFFIKSINSTLLILEFSFRNKRQRQVIATQSKLPVLPH